MVNPKYEPPAKPDRGPTDLNAMPEGEDLARAAIKLDRYARHLGNDARMFRDRGIRAMRAQGKLSLQEIADALGISLGAVKAVRR